MNSENFFITVAGITAIVLLSGAYMAAHQAGKRDAAARELCIESGSNWIVIGSGSKGHCIGGRRHDDQ